MNTYIIETSKDESFMVQGEYYEITNGILDIGIWDTVEDHEESVASFKNWESIRKL